MDDPIVNRVQESGLIQVDLSSLPEPRPVDSIDVAQWLDNGFILVKAIPRCRGPMGCFTARTSRRGVGVHHDAILPDRPRCWWQPSSVRSDQQPSLDPWLRQVLAWREAVHSLDLDAYKDERVIVKGCASVGGPGTLVTFTNHVGPVVRSLMFGEACSAVPLVKNPRP